MTLIEKLNRLRVEIALERARVRFGDSLCEYASRYWRNQRIIDGLKAQCGVEE